MPQISQGLMDEAEGTKWFRVYNRGDLLQLRRFSEDMIDGHSQTPCARSQMSQVERPVMKYTPGVSEKKTGIFRCG